MLLENTYKSHSRLSSLESAKTNRYSTERDNLKTEDQSISTEGTSQTPIQRKFALVGQAECHQKWTCDHGYKVCGSKKRERHRGQRRIDGGRLAHKRLRSSNDIVHKLRGDVVEMREMSVKGITYSAKARVFVDVPRHTSVLLPNLHESIPRSLVHVAQNSYTLREKFLLTFFFISCLTASLYCFSASAVTSTEGAGLEMSLT